MLHIATIAQYSMNMKETKNGDAFCYKILNLNLKEKTKSPLIF